MGALEAGVSRGEVSCDSADVSANPVGEALELEQSIRVVELGLETTTAVGCWMQAFLERGVALAEAVDEKFLCN